MLACFNAQERTLGQYMRLGAAAGWKLERVHRAKEGQGLNQLVFSPM